MPVVIQVVQNLKTSEAELKVGWWRGWHVLAVAAGRYDAGSASVAWRASQAAGAAGKAEGPGGEAAGAALAAAAAWPPTCLPARHHHHHHHHHLRHLQEAHKALQQQHAALQAQAAAKGLANIELQRELQAQWAAGEPAMLQLKQLLLDPAVNREFTRLSSELDEARAQLRAAQDELRAVTFTAVRCSSAAAVVLPCTVSTAACVQEAWCCLLVGSRGSRAAGSGRLLAPAHRRRQAVSHPQT